MRSLRPARRSIARPGHGFDIDGEVVMRVSGTLSVGKGVTLSSRLALTHVVVDSGAVLTIGDQVRIGHGVALACSKRVSIGARSTLAPFCMIADTDFHVAGDSGLPPQSHPIDIGADVVIGPHALVMPGTTIGDGARIDAGSVVSGDVPEGNHFGGNPATSVGRRSSGSIVRARAVSEIVAEVFGLDSPPDGSVRPEQVDGWDSLGSLRLLVAIEAEYGTTIDDRSLESVVDVAGWSRATEPVSIRTEGA